MAYYPIKCVRCMSVCTNQTVLFDAAKSNVSVTDRLKGTAPTPMRPSEPESDGPLLSVAPAREMPPSPSAIGGRKMDFRDFRERYTNILPRYKEIKNVTRSFSLGEEEEGLLIGITYEDDDGLKKDVSHRYCPQCGAELPTLSGSMPTYLIMVLGTSSSGKTVYLAALNHLLSSGSTGKLPFRAVLSSTSGGLGNDELNAISNRIFQDGQLPATTIDDFTEPLVLQLVYKMPRQIDRRCLVGLVDMRGEDTTVEGGNRLRSRRELHESADAFMMIIDPENTPYLTPGSYIHQQLIDAIQSHVLAEMPENRIAVPSAIVLTKADILIQKQRELEIHAANAALSPRLEQVYDQDYWNAIDTGVRQILTKLDPQLLYFLQTSFGAARFTTCASLGRDVTLLESQQVQNPHQLRPWRVQDPLVILLAKLGFIPDYLSLQLGNEEHNKQLFERWRREVFA